jgi:hypothetical protein
MPLSFGVRCHSLMHLHAPEKTPHPSGEELRHSRPNLTSHVEAYIETRVHIRSGHPDDPEFRTEATSRSLRSQGRLEIRTKPRREKVREREASRCCATAPWQEKNTTSSYPREDGGTTRTRQGDTYRSEPSGNSAVPLRRTGPLFPVSCPTEEGRVLSRHLDAQTHRPSKPLLTSSHQGTERRTSSSEEA